MLPRQFDIALVLMRLVKWSATLAHDMGPLGHAPSSRKAMNFQPAGTGVKIDSNGGPIRC